MSVVALYFSVVKSRFCSHIIVENKPDLDEFCTLKRISPFVI